MNNQLVLRQQAEIEPQQNNVITALSGMTIPDERTVIQLAARLVDHWSGKITGGYQRVTNAEREAAKKNGFPPDWRKTLDRDGNDVLVKPPRGKYDPGELLFSDAIYVIEKYLPMLVNPLAHVSLWYQDGKVIDHLDYAVKIGWATDQADFVTEVVEMTADERKSHSLNDGDLGMIAYMILAEDKQEWRRALVDLIKGGMPAGEAKRLSLDIYSKAKGVGILRKGETNKPAPKGRSFNWLCEKRALTDMVQRGVGKMTPAQVAKQMMSHGTALHPGDLPALLESGYPDDAPAEAQQRYVEMYHRAEAIKANPNPDWQTNVDLMRDNDADPLELSPEDDEPEPTPDPEPEPIPEPTKPKAKNGGKVASDVSTQFWLLAGKKGIDRDAGLALIGEHGGSVDDALEALKKLPAGEPVQKSMIEQGQPNNYQEE